MNGNAERVDWLRQRYDSGEEVELEKEADLASAVSLLRLFLQELPEPVIPTALQGHILQLYQGMWQGHTSPPNRLTPFSWLAKLITEGMWGLMGLLFTCFHFSGLLSNTNETIV